MEQVKEPWRHHYIPVFYLKNFTCHDGHFFVFDKEINDFPRNSRRSPKQICFEPNRNTLVWESEKFQHTGLETETYQYFDSKMSEVFKELNDSTIETFKWRDELVGNLEHFITLLYWRLPCNDNRFEQTVNKAQSLKDFGLKAINNKTGKEVLDNEVHKLFLQDKNIQKALKPVLSYTSLLGNLPEDVDNWEWRIVYWYGRNSRLTSDNPIIPRLFESFNEGEVNET